jgi:hypothetical protein
MSVDRARDRSVGPAGLVLVDHCRTLAVVAHPGHQVLDADAGRGGEGVPGVAQIMEVRALQPDIRLKLLRRSGAPLGPGNISEPGPGATKTAMCSRSAGMITAGIPTVRRPARDFTGAMVILLPR